MEYETEWQFDAPDLALLRGQLESRHELAGFRLRRCPARELTDRYLDTADARMAQAGFALRLRSDGGRCEATLKSLRSDSTDMQVRKEIRQSVGDASVATLLAAGGPVSDRTRAVTGDAQLEPLLTVRTHRDVFQLSAGDVDAAEIVLDETRFGEADAPATATLQRVELELHTAPATALEPVLAELRGPLALEPARLSKLEAGLAACGGRLLPTAARTALQFQPGMTAVAAGQQYLQQQLAKWRELEPAVRLGEDPEALHQLRVTARHLIAALRLLEAAQLGGALGVRRRLQALLRRLGPLRDLDVQCEELAQVDRTLPAHELAPLNARLRQQRQRRQQRLPPLLDAPRVRGLFAALDELVARAPRRRAMTLAAAAGPLLQRRYRRMRRAARLAIDETSVVQCHALRLQAKKLRYLAEPLAELYGEPMRRFLRRLQKLQTLLGRINDAHHAMTSLEQQAQRRRGLPSRALFAMGRVSEHQRQQFDAARGQLPEAWRRVRGKSWRRLRVCLQAPPRAAQRPLDLPGSR